MTKRNAGLLVCALAAGLALTQAAHARARVTVQIIADNSFFAVGDNDARALKMGAFAQLLRMGLSRRLDRDTKIDVISTNRPRTVWSGSPLDILRDEESLKTALAPVPGGCADLVGAFDVLRQNLSVSSAGEIYVIVLAGLVTTGQPCDGVTVQLPQPVPLTLDASFLARDERITTLGFFDVMPEQSAGYASYFETLGIALRSRSGGYKRGYNFLGRAGSQDFLAKQIIEGGR